MELALLPVILECCPVDPVGARRFKTEGRREDGLYHEVSRDTWPGEHSTILVCSETSTFLYILGNRRGKIGPRSLA